MTKMLNSNKNELDGLVDEIEEIRNLMQQFLRIDDGKRIWKHF